MIESFTVFSKTGEILYHYSNFSSFINSNSLKNGKASPLYYSTTSSIDVHQPTSSTLSLINDFLTQYLKSQISGGPKSGHIDQNRVILDNKKEPTNVSNLQYVAQNSKIVAEWEESSTKDWIAVIFYPKVMLDNSYSNQGSTMGWIKILLNKILKEYALFHDCESKDDKNDDNEILSGGMNTFSDKNQLFDDTFRTVYKYAESLGREERQSSGGPTSQEEIPLRSPIEEDSTNTIATKKKKKKGKENRVWYDGTQKITAKSMAALDRSKSKSDQSIDVALAEARATYLPSDGEIPLWEEEDVVLKDDEDNNHDGGWGESLKGMLSQISGNKVLTEQDLKQPLQEIQKLLTSKNVASNIASEVCQKVRDKLIGRKMSSLRVKTCVREALEVIIERILTKPKLRNVDLLKEIITKRQGSLFRRTEEKKPYVIVMSKSL